MKFELDGSIVFEEGETLPLLSMYQPHPTIKNKFVPKFAFDCTARLFINKIKPCSKKFSFLWWCVKFQQSTSIKTCEACDAPDKPGHDSAEVTFILPEELTCKLH